MNHYCFVDGEMVPLEEAKVSVLDIGILRGYGIYDALAVINGKPLQLADHWQRFVMGANALDIKIPITKDTLEEKIIEITEKSGFTARANIRMILTGGRSINGIEYDPQSPTFFVTVDKWRPLPTENYINGTKLITYNYRRETPKIKTTNYITAVSLQNRRKEQKAVEILYIYGGEVLECATSNIFLVKNGKLATPKENILEGVTRKIVIELARGGYGVEEKRIKSEELKSADEIFITSSFKDIVPIVEIDDFRVAGGRVGPVTKDFMGKFARYIGRDGLQ